MWAWVSLKTHTKKLTFPENEILSHEDPGMRSAIAHISKAMLQGTSSVILAG